MHYIFGLMFGQQQELTENLKENKIAFIKANRKLLLWKQNKAID